MTPTIGQNVLYWPDGPEGTARVLLVQRVTTDELGRVLVHGRCYGHDREDDYTVGCPTEIEGYERCPAAIVSAEPLRGVVTEVR